MTDQNYVKCTKRKYVYKRNNVDTDLRFANHYQLGINSVDRCPRKADINSSCRALKKN